MIKTQKASYAYIVRSPDDMSAANCGVCNKTLSLDNFYQHSIRSDGWVRYRPKCKSCRCKGPRTHWSRPKHAEIISKGVQECKHCKEKKPLNKFYSNGCFNDGVKKYRTKCIECVLLDSKNNQQKNYEKKIRIRSSSPRNYIVALLNHSAQRTKERKYNLDLLYLMEMYKSQKGRCAISDVEMTYIAGKGRVYTNISIDRIDSKIGYEKGNIQLVCFIVNVMKHDGTLENLIHWCKEITRAQEVKNSTLAKGCR